MCELRRFLGSAWGKGGVGLPLFPQACFHSPFHDPSKEQRGPGYGSTHMVRIVSAWAQCGMLFSCRNLLLHNSNLLLAEINLSSSFSLSRACPLVVDISGLVNCFRNHCMSCFMEVLLYALHQQAILNWKKNIKDMRLAPGRI